jgi:hypothetical protein
MATHLPLFRALVCLCLTAGAALVVWLPVASAGDRPAPDRLMTGGHEAHVRWSGFHGVKFGEPLPAAAKQLHGRVTSDEPRSDAKGVNYSDALVGIGGSMEWEEYDGVRSGVRSGSTVGSFLSTSERVMFPRHTFAGEPLAKFKRALGKGARPERPEHNAAIGDYLVGPNGRTLWAWGSSDTGVAVIGIAESLAGAETDWGYEG